MNNLTKAWNSLGRKRWLLILGVAIIVLLIIFGANLLSWWSYLTFEQKIAAIIAVITATLARLFGEAILATLKSIFKTAPTESPKTAPSPEIPGSKIPRPPQYGFVARYDDAGNDLVERVVNLLSQNRAVALIGAGGLGKTTLAAEIARMMQSKERCIVWTSADGRADFSLGALLDETATQLGNPEARTLALEQKMNAVRALLGQTVGVFEKTPSQVFYQTPLLIIDNFETIAAEQQRQIADFISTLSCAVLVTSRAEVQGAERVGIGAMTPDEAREFLRGWIAASPKQKALTPLIDEIAKTAERNPMVMRWIVGQLERAQRMQDVLDELSRGQGDAATRVFGRSFGLLYADAQATFLSLALFVPSANRAALAFTAGFGDAIHRLNDALKPLADLQLLETDANNERLSVVGLTRRFTIAQLDQDANVAEYLKRFVEYFVKYSEAHAETTPEDLNILEGERGNLLIAKDIAFAAKDWWSVIRIAVVIGRPYGGLLGVHGYWDDAIILGQQATEAAEREGDESGVAVFMGNIATVHYFRGDKDKARGIYERVLEISKRLNDEQNTAVWLHQLGMIAKDEENYVMAQTRYTESLEIEKKLGNQNGILYSLGELGNLEYVQRNFDAAQKYYDEILTLFKKLGSQSGIAKTWNQLGNIALDKGDYETARARYAESLDIAKKLGDQNQIAITLHNLGVLAVTTGDKEEGVRLFREALIIWENLKSPDAELARESLERVEGLQRTKSD